MYHLISKKPNRGGRICLVAGMFAAVLSAASASTSASDNGITWFFDKDYPVGKFADGSNYVVTGTNVVVTRITPAWDGRINGAELNPKVRNAGVGWAAGVENYPYDAALNVASRLPLTLVPGDMLASARGNSGNVIQDISILTVLAEAPPDGSFRPPLAGTDKKIRGNVSQLDYNILPDLADPGVSTPTADKFVQEGGARYYLELGEGWKNSSLKTEEALPNYGRDLSRETGNAVLWLCLNNPDEVKARTLVPMVQRGIDTFGLIKSGYKYAPNGGHNGGRKLVMGVTAMVLRDGEMLALMNGANLAFQEDGQHDYIKQVDVDFTQAGNEPFTQQMLTNWNGTGRAMPEWFSNGIDARERRISGAQWDKKYRRVNGIVNVGVSLAAELLGMRAAWNDEAFFEYVEKRFWPIDRASTGEPTSIHPFPVAMWERHRGAISTRPQPPTGLRIVPKAK